MQLFIRLIDNKLIVLDVHPHQTIGDIKKAIYERCPNMPVPNPSKGTFELTRSPWNHYSLNNDYSLEQYGVSNEQTLNMIYRRTREPSIPISE